MNRCLITVVAHVPEEQMQEFLQHVRDYDSRHSDCHFQITAFTPNTPTADMVDILREISPAFDILMAKQFKREQ